MKSTFTMAQCLYNLFSEKHLNTEQIKNACQAKLNESDPVETKLKLGRLKNGKREFKFKESETTSFTGTVNVVTKFIEFSQTLERAERLSPITLAELPENFIDWLGKFETKPTT